MISMWNQTNVRQVIVMSNLALQLIEPELAFIRGILGVRRTTVEDESSTSGYRGCYSTPKFEGKYGDLEGDFYRESRR
jgi:hypothetical protein